MFKSILVLESSWDKDTVDSQSVWPFIREFANVIGLHAHHQTFSDKNSFEHWINLYNHEKLPKDKLLYIAAHGSKNQINGLSSSINRESVFTILKRSKNLKFIHFGSCNFGNDENLGLVLKNAKHIKWAAGYSKSVDWIDSTLIDILFWHRQNSHDTNNKGLKTQNRTRILYEDIPLAEKNWL